MLVLHANWTEGALRLWGETRSPGGVRTLDEDHAGNGVATVVASATLTHPFAADTLVLRQALVQATVIDPEHACDEAMVPLRLPCDSTGPRRSERFQAITGDDDVTVGFGTFHVPALGIRGDEALATLLRIEDRLPIDGVEAGHDLAWWVAVSRFLVELLADQRTVPTLYQQRGERVRAAWRPWLHDEAVQSQLGWLLDSMPPAARAVVDELDGSPWTILEQMLDSWTDATVRRALMEDEYGEAIEDRDPREDPHVGWLTGLLHDRNTIDVDEEASVEMLLAVRRWIAQLLDIDRDRPFRLYLWLQEPFEPEDDEPTWRLEFGLSSTEQASRRFDAEQIWGLGGSTANALPIEHPQDTLLTELGRAARICPRIQTILAEPTPTGLDFTTAEAYEFLREYTPVLEESGFELIVPDWWHQPESRLGVRLLIESDDEEPPEAGPGTGSNVRRGDLGFETLVRYRWRISLGEQTLTMEEFEALTSRGTPLARVHDRWVEIRPDDMQAAARFLADHAAGAATVAEALQLAFGNEARDLALPVVGVEMTGWVDAVFGATSEEDRRFRDIDQPEAFRGELRPYQRTGLSWLAFLDRCGFGACLADDMGLGKTIQLISLLQHEREFRSDNGPGPTLLIAPTSVVENWKRELARFAPDITVRIHHGIDRPSGDAFLEVANATDVVVTTYALVTRDHDSLKRVDWHRVVLDEAQHIKNPPTKQAAAIRSLDTRRRIALTGTPVENRLSELWSIMEFCNPGYLGSQAEFRRHFAVPIERHRDRRQGERLRSLIRPFVLRRVKTDREVISDLPPLVETREYATLTSEQARLYEAVVNDMLVRVDQAAGIQRRGLVLSALVKLKQICNHPVNYLKEDGQDEDRSLSARSGKSHRLVEMLDELLAAGDKALIFTQYRQMGHLLVSMINQDLDCEALFLHGGTPQARRQQMIDRFQDPDGGAPVFVLSLRAGGVGLNLTAGNHVFHFDRWWNPAVENQATDRAFRIGQTRTVHVHKFICSGTLEERIDQMIERKTELAEQIIGAGEQWVTELSTGQLRELLTLRRSDLDIETEIDP
jgi:superfamily II DNA or RNA helicase